MSGRHPRQRGEAGVDRPGPRRAARLAAVQALYQMTIAGLDAETVIAEFVGFRLGRPEEGLDPGPADEVFFAELVRGVSAHHDELDNMIAGVLSEEWSIDRLEAILRQILRAGAFELAHSNDTPARSIIAEYLALAEAFFGGRVPGLVNGVLDRLARSVRPLELEKSGRDRTATTG